ncbi:MAG: Slp family lipoprotein [Chromatiales bacterium]
MLTFAAILLHGCARNVPVEIRKAPSAAPDLPAVASNPQAHDGQRVRWGGTIISVENQPNETWVEILAKKLDYFGEPQYTDRSLGRFLARSEGFLDPQVYRKDRELTIYGTVAGSRASAIGAKPYTYPVVKVEKSYLWPQTYAGGNDPLCRDAYYGSSIWYRHPAYWHRHGLGYHYWRWDPFWDPFPPSRYCRR